MKSEKQVIKRVFGGILYNLKPDIIFIQSRLEIMRGFESVKKLIMLEF